jgi:hypothetical protein
MNTALHLIMEKLNKVSAGQEELKNDTRAIMSGQTEFEERTTNTRQAVQVRYNSGRTAGP